MNGEEYETMEWLKEMSGRVDNGEIDAEGAEELILSCIRNFQHPSENVAVASAYLFAKLLATEESLVLPRGSLEAVLGLMEREETREAGVVALYALSFHEEIAMPETVRALKNSLEKSNPEAMVYAISLIEKLCEKWKGVDTEILTKIGALEDNMATVLAFDPNLETWAPVKISAYAESALKKIGGYRLVKSLEAYLMTANEISGIQRLLGSGDETERIEAAKTLRNLTKKWIVEYPWLFGKEFIEEVVEEMEKSSNPQFVASTLEMISLVSSGSKDSANIVAGSLDGIIHAVFENTVLESKKDRDFVISLLLRLIFTTLPLLDEKAAREFVTAHFELFSSWLGEEEPEVVGLTLSLFLLFCNLGLLEETHKDVLNTKLYDIQSEEILQKEFVDPNGKKEKISGIFGSLSSKIMETEEAHYVDILRREYRIGRLLGSGATCEVYLATRKKDNFPVALKIYREEFGDKAKRTFTRELTHWKELTDIESPRVVKFYGLVKLPGLTRDVLEVEYMPGGSLKDYVEKEKPQQAKLGRLLYQMVEGLIYAAYKAQIYHTDMKPEHILLSHDRRECKITDWGGSRKGHSRSTSYARTDRWCAPEQIIGSTLPTERSTVYAVASIIYWTFTGKAPFESFPGESEETIRKKKINREKPEIPPDLDERLRNLLDECFEPEHTKRPKLIKIARVLNEVFNLGYDVEALRDVIMKHDEIIKRKIEKIKQVEDEMNRGISYRKAKELLESLEKEGCFSEKLKMEYERLREKLADDPDCYLDDEMREKIKKFLTEVKNDVYETQM